MAKYGKAAAKRVKSAVSRTKKGTLKSGSGRKVTSRKQAIAIGLSEARQKGAKVPARKGARKTARKSGPKTARKTSRPAARKTSRTSSGARKRGRSRS
jgi:Family of unknown function (DUF6496)